MPEEGPRAMTNTGFTLAYGGKTQAVDLARCELLGAIRPREMPGLADPEDALRGAIAASIASPPLREIVRPGERVTVIIPDVTRLSRCDLYLPVLTDELSAAGVADAAVTILIGGGAHPPATDAEQQALVGERLRGRVRVIAHDSRDDDSHVTLGSTSRGTPVSFDRAALDADRIIVTGAITHHYHSGFTGGRKGMMPGIACYEAVQANHSRLLDRGGRGVNPNCRAGQLDGNPIHEDMIEAVRMRPPDFLLNVVVNDRREIAGVFAGDWVEAHRRGAEFVDAHLRIPIPAGPADLVVASAGGYPRDINFYQAHKAVEFASYAVRDGGVIVAAAECAQGLGPPEFRQHFELGSVEAIEAQLRRLYRVPGGTAMAMLRKARRCRIILVTWLPVDDVRLMQAERAPDLATALDLAIEQLGPRPRTYVMPQAYVTVPEAAGSS